jgi:E3 ubiquitin ligase SMURF1/2
LKKKKIIICGKEVIDVEEMKANAIYDKRKENQQEIEWFWKAVESFDQEKRKRLLQLITGSTRLLLKEFKSGERDYTNPITIYFSKIADKNSLPVIHSW